jgi:hypothetical protein
MFVPNVKQAALGPITVPSGFAAVPSGAGLYVTALILGTCLLSFAVTHLLYFLAVGREVKALVRALLAMAQRLCGSSAPRRSLLSRPLP